MIMHAEFQYNLYPFADFALWCSSQIGNWKRLEICRYQYSQYIWLNDIVTSWCPEPSEMCEIPEMHRVEMQCVEMQTPQIVICLCLMAVTLEISIAKRITRLMKTGCSGKSTLWDHYQKEGSVSLQRKGSRDFSEGSLLRKSFPPRPCSPLIK